MMKYSRLKNRYGPGGNDGLVSGIEYAVRLTSSIFMGRLLSCLALADYAAAYGNNRGCKIGSEDYTFADVIVPSRRPHGEERALARVSNHEECAGHPSRRAPHGALLRMRIGRCVGYLSLIGAAVFSAGAGGNAV